MGVLNITPDSFSDGGAWLDSGAAIRRAHEMAAEGADLIDVGGESTRPGARGVSVQEELDRVLPVIESLTGTLAVPVSIDTSKPEVMRSAVRGGATMINDVNALRQPGALEAAQACEVPVVLMHMQGEPRTMQEDPHYEDVTGEVRAFLEERIRACTQAGIDKARLLVDPGFGFGKSLAHNLTLLRELGSFRDLGAPVLVGLSRKSMLGELLDRPVDERLYGSLALAALAIWNGAHIIRAHDVGATRDAVRVCHAVRTSSVREGEDT